MRDRTVFRVFAPGIVALVAVVGALTSGCAHNDKDAAAGSGGGADQTVGQQNAAGQAQAYQQKLQGGQNGGQNPGQSMGQNMAAGQAQAHQGGAPR